jgi:hypothetical protein
VEETVNYLAQTSAAQADLASVQARVRALCREQPDHSLWTQAEKDRWFIVAELARLTRIAQAETVVDEPPRAARPTATQAKTMGYTGDLCDKCSSLRVVRKGVCLFCLDCNESIGGCS